MKMVKQVLQSAYNRNPSVFMAIHVGGMVVVLSLVLTVVPAYGGKLGWSFTAAMTATVAASMVIVPWVWYIQRVVDEVNREMQEEVSTHV